MRKPHIGRGFEDELSQLRERIAAMGAKVQEMIARSMQAHLQRDSDLARQTIGLDPLINRLEMDIDELCVCILARRQPVASDLRFITMALKAVTDLERIGDSAVNICERIIELNEEPQIKLYVGISQMAELVQRMVREALDAFVAGDAAIALRVIEQDQSVDAHYVQLFRELLTYMLEDPRTISRALCIQSIAKHLERVGDHATNLAEMVVYMVGGKDIRHPGRLGDT